MGSKSLTKPPKQLEIAVVAVSALGGAKRSIDTEDVAIKCHELAPGLFSWRKHASQVNLELVRVSLSDAKKPKNGSLLSGSGREGWRLTILGLEWLESQKHSPLIRNEPLRSLDAAARNAGSIDTVRRDREIVRLESSAAWATWRDGGKIAPSDAQSFFRIDSYTSPRLIENKITRLLALFDAGSDHRRFLETAAAATKKES